MTKAYTSNDIQILTDQEHVRKRTPIYLGNTNPTEYNVPIFTGTSIQVETFTVTPAVFKAVGEIIDNATDEFSQISQKTKVLTIDAVPSEGKYTVSDNGRGVPIDRHASGRYTPEVVFGSLRSGRNFDDNKKQQGVIGTNGVGSSVVNFCSKKFNVEIHRDGKRYNQTFENGATNITVPEIKRAQHASGTKISFELDKEVFGEVSIPDAMLTNRAIELAMTNPGVTVVYNGTPFSFPNGMRDIVGRLQNATTFMFTVSDDIVSGEIFVCLDAHEGVDEQMFTWVNSSLLFDGGKCNTQFLNAFFNQTQEALQREAAKQKAEITKNDIRKGLMVLANLKIKNPEYDSQSKTRLTGPDFRLQFQQIVAAQWKLFERVGKNWMQRVLEAAVERFHQTENTKAIQNQTKTIKRRKMVEGLLDATERKDRSKCQVFITEGLSARSQLSDVRDPVTTGAFALTGKINNVYGCTPAQVLKMGKLTDLLTAIGLVPGRPANKKDMHFGRIVISTDADYDGDHIFTLLTNLLFQFWPELFDPTKPPTVYRLVAPNICLTKKGKPRIHFPNRQTYEANKHKYKGYDVHYYKGLGSMEPEDWEMILHNDSECYVPIVDDGNLKDMLALLFNDDSDARKIWLQGEYHGR